MREGPPGLKKCTDRARYVARLASELSLYRSHADIQPRDFLDALSNDEAIAAAALGAVGISKVDYPVGLKRTNVEILERSETLRVLLAQAMREATELDHYYAGSEHFLLAL